MILDAADVALEAAGKAIAAARKTLAAAKAEKPTVSALRELPHNMTRKQARKLLSLETRVYDRVAREHGRRPGKVWIVPTVRLLEAIDAAPRHEALTSAPAENPDGPLPFEQFASRLRRKAG